MHHTHFDSKMEWIFDDVNIEKQRSIDCHSMRMKIVSIWNFTENLCVLSSHLDKLDSGNSYRKLNEQISMRKNWSKKNRKIKKQTEKPVSAHKFTIDTKIRFIHFDLYEWIDTKITKKNNQNECHITDVKFIYSIKQQLTLLTKTLGIDDKCVRKYCQNNISSFDLFGMYHQWLCEKRWRRKIVTTNRRTKTTS